MAEGILTASITESGGISFQTTAKHMSGSISYSTRNQSTSKSFTATFDYTPSFIIVMPLSGSTYPGANSWTDSTTLNNRYLASGGSFNLIYGTGNNGTVTGVLSFSGSTVTIKLTAACANNATGINGEFSCCIYGAI